MIPRAAIENAFRSACAEELAAPKPGNVGIHAAGHRMTIDDFLRSADVAAPNLSDPAASLGQRILGAVSATRAAVGQNTNLGIILLCAPLAKAAQEADGDLRAALVRVLEQSGLADAEAVFRAITLASPGGLGEAPRHDVRAPATVPLGVAMAEAADQDRIARQWVSGFADVFGPGMVAYTEGLARWPDPQWAALAVYLRFLAAFPDSHILRKHGVEEAERTRREAVPIEQRLRAVTEPSTMLAELLAWDAVLKQRGVNPGTSADLVVATIFADHLVHLLRSAGNDG
jgi:triphosphoribosyl-dephospho-CoA synthase